MECSKTSFVQREMRWWYKETKIATPTNNENPFTYRGLTRVVYILYIQPSNDRISPKQASLEGIRSANHFQAANPRRKSLKTRLLDLAIHGELPGLGWVGFSQPLNSLPAIHPSTTVRFFAASMSSSLPPLDLPVSTPVLLPHGSLRAQRWLEGPS